MGNTDQNELQIQEGHSENSNISKRGNNPKETMLALYISKKVISPVNVLRVPLPS